MKTKSLLTAIAIVVLSSSVGYAQRVEATMVDGHPVINCEGMPASTYTTTPKGNTEELLKTGDANKTVYKRFAVYNRDNNTGADLTNWSSAFTVCSGISGGQWRLPTQRELMLMWVLKRELKLIPPSGDHLSSHSYWCASVYNHGDGNGNDYCTVDLDRGGTSFRNKDDTYEGKYPMPIVRCIRELPMP